jgi:nucleoid-associated protein YgaU
MSRYKDANIIMRKLKDNKNWIRASETVIYQRIPKSDTDIYLITQVGDRLDTLANQFYGDPSLWWYIAHANNLMTMNLEVGISLRLPSDTRYVELFK